ncbi:hypothetical protein J3S85_37270 [Streptomyces lavenduligriseus]|nr:hypothetical protein J3S85_37270 [Streptomyces lavenduligriseus]
MGDLGGWGQELGKVADLVGPARGVQDQDVAAYPQQPKAFAAGPNLLRDGHLHRAGQGLGQQLLRLGRDLPDGLEEAVAPGDPHRADRLQRQERPAQASAGQSGGGQAGGRPVTAGKVVVLIRR